ncbi:MAG TPA: hypothetical protein VG328_05615 [Stellaceae bacterium]|jgi:hypothetical protein|nr:hypothetical protein [Stellaceae bacterium]
MTGQSPPSAVFISTDALKQMIAWSLLCMGVIGSKTEQFDVTVRGDGVVVTPEHSRGK